MDAELKLRIIRKASELFLAHGIRAITMDFIATETGISKRTLYEIFADKDSLLIKTLEYQEEQNGKEREESAKNCSSSFEFCLKEYERVIHRIRRVNRNYMRDLQKYHPKVAVHFEKNREANMKRMIENTEKGMEEGYIRPELNSKILALLLQAQLEILISSDVVEKNQLSFLEVFETIVMNYARAIATAEGLALLEEHLRKKIDVLSDMNDDKNDYK